MGKKPITSEEFTKLHFKYNHLNAQDLTIQLREYWSISNQLVITFHFSHCLLNKSTVKRPLDTTPINVDKIRSFITVMLPVPNYHIMRINMQSIL